MQKIITVTALALVSSMSLTSTAFANTEQEDTAPRLIAPYQDNPNLAHVLAYKTQELVIDGAKKVGEVTEKGIQKIKPGVDRAWESTKELTTRSGEKVQSTAQQVGSTVAETVDNTKQAIRPAHQGAPIIEQQSLSENSASSPKSDTNSSAQTYAVTDL